LLSVAASPTLAQQREIPPPPGAPKDFRLPPRQTVTLPNGLKLSMVRYGAVPKVNVSVEIQTGMIDESADQVQLSALTADLLLEGTTSRSGPDISREAAEMGGALSATGGTDVVIVGGEVLSEFAERFIGLAADVVQHPKFADADVSRVRANRLRDNAISLSSPDEQARQLFRKTMFGEHPYGRLYPSEAALQGYTTEKVRAFYAKNYGARRVHIYVSGVFDPAVVERAVRAGFGTWGAGPERTVRPPTPVSRRRLETLDRPGAVQSVLWMGLPVADPTSPDWIKFNVTDALLGGAFGSRITRNIREDKGYTYSPFSFVWSRPKTALWIEQADVTTAVTGPSLKEIFGEVDKLRAEAPPQVELTGIKNNLVGIFVIQNNSRQGVINQLQFVDQHGLGDGYLAGYVKDVLAVTPDDVKQASIKYLDPAKMSITVVGDQKIVAEQIEPYRPKMP
jgi:predicted Zn-dependent peptidase